jgi:hypothetical protein
MLMTLSTASASIIPTPVEEVLFRADAPDPSPSFGPKFHMTHGDEIIVFPNDVRETSSTVLTFIAFCLSSAFGFLSMIPKVQDLLLRLRLMN